MSLDLPDRVDIDVALKVASSYALTHFVIPKFPNIFVYREKSNKIFYMKLFGKIVTGPVGDQVPSSSDTDSELNSVPVPSMASGDKDKESTPVSGLAASSTISIGTSPRTTSRNNSHGSHSQGSHSDKDSNMTLPIAGLNFRKRQVLIMRVFGGAHFFFHPCHFFFFFAPLTSF